MMRITLFAIVSFLLIILSRRSLKNPGAHGFYRFFVFEGILCLILLNHPHWFIDPFSPQQIISWLLLLASIIFIVHSIIMLKQRGGYAERKDMPENYSFENTTQIVDGGLYHYIRHPMYSSLLFLAWGAFFKHLTPLSTGLVLSVSIFLIITIKKEERENISFFGTSYEAYIKRTKMLLPWLL